MSDVTGKISDSYLAVDNFRVNGTVVESFENGLGANSTSIGNVADVTSGSSSHLTVSPTDGTHEAFLTSAPASEAAIESFLGLAPGRLVNVAHSEGPEYTPVVVPIGVRVPVTTHSDDTFVTISAAPTGSTFDHGTHDSASGTWKVEAADLGGDLTITTLPVTQAASPCR